MPTPRLSDDLAREAVQAWIDCHRSRRDAAKSLGIPLGTFTHRLEAAKERGMHLSLGAKQIIDTAHLGYGEAKGGWIHNYDEDGKKIGATRWSAPEMEQEDMAERIRSALDGIPAAEPAEAPARVLSSLLTVYPIADAHIGMMAWGEETGEDYDTKIATQRLKDWMARAIASSPASDTAVILDVGDMTHADDQKNMTPRSGHILDVDTRHFRTLDLTITALAVAIDLALIKHRKVIVRILPGNHNPQAYMAVMFAIAERYRNEPRCEVQKIPGEFFLMEFGKCLIAAHHGDKAKADRMVMALAADHPEEWGRTRHRFLFTGHLHHTKMEDIGGVTWEQLRAMTARDAYSVAHSYSARAQLQAITYDRDAGEIQRVKVGQL